MEYRTNKILDYIYSYISFVIWITLGLIGYIIFDYDDIGNIGLPLLLIFFGSIFVILIILNFLYKSSERLYLLDDSVKYINNKILYKNIYAIKYRIEIKSRTFKNGPCSLLLYDSNGDLILGIDNPSLGFIFQLKKRCFNSKFILEGHKIIILISIISFAIGLLIGIVK